LTISLEKNLLHQLAYNPKHKGLTKLEKEKSTYVQVDNCDDQLYVYLKLNKGKVEKARFDGHGCSIFLGSIEALLHTIEKKTISEAKNIINEYNDFINGKIYVIDGELNLFKIVRVHKSRIKCASSPINALKEILENE